MYLPPMWLLLLNFVFLLCVVHVGLLMLLFNWLKNVQVDWPAVDLPIFVFLNIAVCILECILASEAPSSSYLGAAIAASCACVAAAGILIRCQLKPASPRATPQLFYLWQHGNAVLLIISGSFKLRNGAESRQTINAIAQIVVGIDLGLLLMLHHAVFGGRLMLPGTAGDLTVTSTRFRLQSL